MPTAKGITTLSGMVDTDIEDDTLNGDAFPTPDSNQENGGHRKKVAKSQTASKKPARKKLPPTRTGGASAVAKNTTTSKSSKKRAPLKDQTNNQYADETEEVDEFAAQSDGDTAMEDVVESKRVTKKSAPTKRSEQPVKKASGRRVAEPQRDGEFEYTPTSVRVKKGARQAPIPMNERVIQETQAPTETDNSMLPTEDDNEMDQEMPQSTYRRPAGSRNTSQRRQPLVSRRRAGSASDNDHPNGGDPATRRKLGEMTRKFENLDLKYRNLREVGINQAEANFEKLRIQSNAKAQLAGDLIKALKKELATHKALNADTNSIQQEILTRDADLKKARTLADDLSKQLAEAQNENKALNTKLANLRTVSATVESLDAKTPASGLRARQQTQTGKTVMVGSAEAAQAAQVAQLKEDLYSDLTGLIMRGVEVATEGDIYDCIQTGPNGTLHFKLNIAKDSENYDQTEIIYTPCLDTNRDRDLIALLPEYLTDEITFSRTNMAKFYGRVVETLTKRRQVEDD